MTDKQWNLIKRCAACEALETVPCAMLVDSPWMPGYAGHTTIDYYEDPETWFDTHVKIKQTLPELIMLPDWWVEFGMGDQPSGYGCVLNFNQRATTTVEHIISDVDDIDRILELKKPNPRRDGLMPLILNRYKRMKSRIHDYGEKVRIVSARGPLNIAAFLMGHSEFLMGIKLEPEKTHQILRMATDVIIDWLEAQGEVLDYVEGIWILDDIVGFLSAEDFAEFAAPYLKEIFSKFDVPVKLFHNDTYNEVAFDQYRDLGFNIFNFSYKTSMTRARELCGENICLMGNVPPLHVMARGTPEECYAATTACLNELNSKKGVLLSCGGGTSAGMSRENVQAMLDALAAWNSAH